MHRHKMINRGLLERLIKHTIWPYYASTQKQFKPDWPFYSLYPGKKPMLIEAEYICLLPGWGKLYYYSTVSFCN